MTFLYGRHAVLEALRAGRGVRRLLLAESAHGLVPVEILTEARGKGVPVQRLDRRALDRLAGDVHHQGVLAEVEEFTYRHLDDLLSFAEARGEPPLLLALDALQDPQNFGTLLRTALAAGCHGAIIPVHRAVGVTPAVVKASAGAVEHLPVARVTNLARALDTLKERGVWVHGLAPAAERPFWEIDLTGPCALVVGSEGPGLSRLVRERCDDLVGLPMAPGSTASLNASVAGSIVLYEALRQRTTAAK